MTHQTRDMTTRCQFAFALDAVSFTAGGIETGAGDDGPEPSVVCELDRAHGMSNRLNATEDERDE